VVDSACFHAEDGSSRASGEAAPTGYWDATTRGTPTDSAARDSASTSARS
jgi:hypothetical protein